jgi:hypothetical protein
LVSADADNLNQLLKVFAPNSFNVIESTQPLGHGANLVDKELWRLIFSALNQNGDLHLIVNLGDGLNGNLTHDHSEESVSSLMKLNGFTNIHVSANVIQGKKPQWQSSGAPLKRREKHTDEI